MKLTPIDIRHRQFGRSMFGLNEEEVIEFLQIVATEMEALVLERNQLREAVREKEIAFAETRERDRLLQSTIQTASQMSERLRVDAEREAKLIIADAQQKAEIITRDSRDSLKKIYGEISDLKRARLQFEANLKGLVQAHLTILEQGEKTQPAFGLPRASIDETKITEISPLSAG
ncbi:MAG: DivIVA domain-containing protein [Bdellovibrionaceae bacterium]|nr:DivIVA domain-containing protein [Pseudobdellovibrionaceae bacterium]